MPTLKNSQHQELTKTLVLQEEILAGLMKEKMGKIYREVASKFGGVQVYWRFRLLMPAATTKREF
jgi:hypothetical protein